MKTVYQLGFMFTAGMVFVAGLYFSNIYLTALALTGAYLCIAILQDRFQDARTTLIEEASRSGSMRFEAGRVYYPLITADGVFVLKNEEDFKTAKLGEVTYYIKKMASYPIKNRNAKKLAIDRKYLEFVFVSRTALRFTLFLSLVLAAFFLHTEDRYSYLVIPVAIQLYHFLLYSRILHSAKEISMANVVNRDTEYLDELMRFYGMAMLGLENPEPSIDILPTGSLAVRFEDLPDTPYYFVTFEEQLYLGELVEKLAETPKDEQIENSPGFC